ncbi:MAG TPA: ATP-binding protein [Ignavibacteria bacterium]|nr:ATP-binding protein [Ignavibacteria bacterium]
MENFTLVLKSNRNEIRRFEVMLEQANQKFNLTVEKFINLQIACSEALINAIVHGNEEDESKNVYTNIEMNELKMSVRIKDEGKGFKVEELPDPTSNENILKENGRGIYIIRSLVDEFTCNSSENGTEFILVVRK